MLAVVPGARTIENTEALVAEARRRTGDRLLRLLTSDEYPAYETAILLAYGERVIPPRTGRPGRPRGPHKVAPAGLNYAVVSKRREKGRVVEVGTRVVFGTAEAVAAALAASKASRSINTAFIERANGTDRHRNARKARKTYRFSKDRHHHEAVTYLSLYSYNFCWPVRTLSVEHPGGGRLRRSPAMAAGLTDHVWSMAEWLSRPVLQHS